jgi:hypothetical protein
MLCATMFGVGSLCLYFSAGQEEGSHLFILAFYLQPSKTRISPHTFFYQGRISSSSHTYVAVRGVSSNSTSESEAMTQC